MRIKEDGTNYTLTLPNKLYDKDHNLYFHVVCVWLSKRYYLLKYVNVLINNEFSKIIRQFMYVLILKIINVNE